MVLIYYTYCRRGEVEILYDHGDLKIHFIFSIIFSSSIIGLLMFKVRIYTALVVVVLNLIQRERMSAYTYSCTCYMVLVVTLPWLLIDTRWC